MYTTTVQYNTFISHNITLAGSPCIQYASWQTSRLLRCDHDVIVNPAGGMRYYRGTLSAATTIDPVYLRDISSPLTYSNVCFVIVADAALSHWVVVGIIFACLCSFAIVVVGCVYLCRRKKATAGNRGQVLSHHGMAMQQQPAHVAVLPMAGPPQPPSYVEKAPTYEPAGAPSIAPSAPPAYSEAPDNYESLQQPGGNDNPTYKH